MAHIRVPSVLVLLGVFWVVGATPVHAGDGADMLSANARNMVETVIVTEEQSAKSISLKVGDTLVVELLAQLGTGFSWQIAGQEFDPLAFAETQIVGGKESLPGSAEFQTFAFTSERPGSVELEFHLRRPWERDKPPARVFKTFVTIVER